MNCRDFLARLDAHLDGELTPAERAAFLSHARDCSVCKEELSRAEGICEALSHMNDDLRVPLPVQAAWRNAVRRESARKKGRAIYRALSAVAAALVLLAGTTVMFRSTGVLDFGGAGAMLEDIHTPASAPRAQVYAPQPTEMTVAPAPRHASIESDGALEESAAIAPLAAGDALEISRDQAWERIFALSAVRVMNTESFDATRGSVVDLADEYGAVLATDALFTEGGMRTATLAVDVPTEDFDAFLEALDFVGHVTYRENNRSDISANYYDAQGRLETLKLEKDRLNALIGGADSAQELAALEDMLEDTYAQIDVLEGKLRGFSGQLDFSRVDITISEGASLSATVISGGQDDAGGARRGFARSLDALGKFFADMGVSLAVIAPYAGVGLVLIAAIWLTVALVARRRRQ